MHNLNQASSEDVFYDSGDIKVTNARISFAETTYQLRAITSVSKETNPPSRALVIAFALSGLALAAAGAWVFGAVLIATSFYIEFTSKQSFSIVLKTSAGEVNALENEDEDMIDNIIHAINNSMVMSKH